MENMTMANKGKRMTQGLLEEHSSCSFGKTWTIFKSLDKSLLLVKEIWKGLWGLFILQSYLVVVDDPHSICMIE